jgi:hypothetical protein
MIAIEYHKQVWSDRDLMPRMKKRALIHPRYAASDLKTLPKAMVFTGQTGVAHRKDFSEPRIASLGLWLDFLSSLS